LERKKAILYCNAGSTRKAEKMCNIKFRQIAVVVKRAVTKMRKELNLIQKKNERII
jgi:hypothetical protein